MSRFLEHFEVERLRKILKGEIKFKKCPDCDEDGLEYCNDGGDTYPHPLEEWGNDYVSSECWNCGGVGFLFDDE